MSSQALKNVGLKVTLPRMKILELLSRAGHSHLSAEDIHRVLTQSGEEIGVATVYRVLTQFEEAGLVIRHHFEGESAVFELNEGEHHDHLVCIQCGKVEEFVDESIEERQREIAQQFQYAMVDHVMNIYGVCPKCQAL